MMKIATWNINSVRLRINLVCRFLRERQPDILCLQETKCPQGQFPADSIRSLGYQHIAESGQKGYHGVAVVSRFPIQETSIKAFCDRDECRHIAVTIKSGRPLTIHNLYVPAGGDEPDPAINDKFAHKLQFLDELEDWFSAGSIVRGREGIVVGDFNVAPLEHDVWSHREMLKVVSHTPVETQALTRVQRAGKWVDLVRQHVPPERKLYTWWSYRAKDWSASDRGRRLDHVWSTPKLASSCNHIEVLREARGWPQPSDHVPVIASFNLEA